MSEKIELSPEILTEIVARAVARAQQPTEDEKRRLDAEEDKRIKSRRAELVVALTTQLNEELRQANCPHVKENGAYTISGQPTSGDGMFVQTCSRCGGVWKSPMTESIRQAIEQGSVQGIMGIGQRVPVCDAGFTGRHLAEVEKLLGRESVPVESRDAALRKAYMPNYDHHSPNVRTARPGDTKTKQEVK